MISIGKGFVYWFVCEFIVKLHVIEQCFFVAETVIALKMVVYLYPVVVDSLREIVFGEIFQSRLEGIEITSYSVMHFSVVSYIQVCQYLLLEFNSKWSTEHQPFWYLRRYCVSLDMLFMFKN